MTGEWQCVGSGWASLRGSGEWGDDFRKWVMDGESDGEACGGWGEGWMLNGEWRCVGEAGVEWGGTSTGLVGGVCMGKDLMTPPLRLFLSPHHKIY